MMEDKLFECCQRICSIAGRFRGSESSGDMRGMKHMDLEALSEGGSLGTMWKH